MRRLALALIVALSFAAASSVSHVDDEALVAVEQVLVDDASAHTSTCSHYGAGYYVTIPNGKIYYEDYWVAGYTQTGGTHKHDYRTRKKTYTNGVGWSGFSLVHYHYGRVCPEHPIRFVVPSSTSEPVLVLI